MAADKNKGAQILKNLALVSQIGISMLTPILGGLLIGAWLDRKFEKAPLFLLLLGTIGIFSAFRALFLLTGKKSKRDGTDEKDKK